MSGELKLPALRDCATRYPLTVWPGILQVTAA
jgi:hypothetical protein